MARFPLVSLAPPAIAAASLSGARQSV